MAGQFALSVIGSSGSAALVALLRSRRPDVLACIAFGVAAALRHFTKVIEARAISSGRKILRFLDFPIYWLYTVLVVSFSCRKLPLSNITRDIFSVKSVTTMVQGVCLWSIGHLIKRIPHLRQPIQWGIAALWTMHVANVLDAKVDLEENEGATGLDLGLNLGLLSLKLQAEDIPRRPRSAGSTCTPGDLLGMDAQVSDGVSRSSSKQTCDSTDDTETSPFFSCRSFDKDDCIDACHQCQNALDPMLVESARQLPSPPPSVPIFDALAAKALESLLSHVDATDFVPSHGARDRRSFVGPEEDRIVELGQKPIKKFSIPAVRGKMVIDTADLPGDPEDLWAHLAEFAAAIVSDKLYGWYDPDVFKTELLVVSQSMVVTWLGTRPNPIGLMYDYILGTTMQVGEDSITVARFSIPKDVVSMLGRSIRVPSGNGYLRNCRHISGFDVRKVGTTARGHKLQITSVMHMDLEGAPMWIPKSLAIHVLINTMRSLMIRLQECICMRLRPENVHSASEGMSETLFPLHPIGGKPLNVPYYVYRVLKKKLTDCGSAAASEPFLSCGQGGPFVEGVVADAIVEQAAQAALQRTEEYLSSTTGWELQDVDLNREGIMTHTRTIKGSKLPMIRCKLSTEIPQRCADNLRLAAFEAAALWLNQSTLHLLNPLSEESAVLRRCHGGVAMWAAPGRVVARAIQVLPEPMGGVTIRIAESSIPSDYAKSTFLTNPRMVIADRVHVQSVVISAMPAGEKSAGKLEVTTLLSVMGDGIPSMLPTFLVRKGIVMLQPSKISRWRSIWNSDLFPKVIETGGGNSSPKINTINTVIGGRSWQIDEDLLGRLEHLLRDL